jgi:DNA-binding NarL/FixJ family response regulator
MPVRLVLADDHPLILQGLVDLFHREEEFEVLARCTDGVETLQALHRYQPDILILDIRMPRKDGLAVLREIHQQKLLVRVVLLTAALDDAEVLEAMRLGVGGVILKDMALQLLMHCVRKVYAGEHWLEKRSTGRILEKMLRREAGAREVGAILTPRELEVVQLVAHGLRNREIADQLCISEGTVKIHLHNSYEKLHVNSRVELLRYVGYLGGYMPDSGDLPPRRHGR